MVDTAMCINKLGIALEGYKDGAVLLFRGTEMPHYVSRWRGKYRYAFDYTTHQSVENMVSHHRKHRVWLDEHLIKDDNDPNEAEIKKKAATKRKREAQEGGDNEGEEEEEVPRPRKRATRAKTVKTKQEAKGSDDKEEEAAFEAMRPNKKITGPKPSARILNRATRKSTKI